MPERETREYELNQKFERRLAKIDLTLNQKELLKALKNARPGDDFVDIGSGMSPPMTGAAVRVMMYRIRIRYRNAKALSNLYEEITSAFKKSRYKLM